VGGTLLVGKAKKTHPFYKQKLEEFGFAKVATTDAESDGLNSIIREMRPELMIIEARFYDNATAYMMGDLLRIFPKLNIAAVSLDRYSEELGMSLIKNGVKSYISWADGIDEFKKGMEAIRDGKCYVSAGVLERIELRSADVEPAKRLAKRQKEVSRLTCSGYTEYETADTLHISRTTVVKHKTNIFRNMNVRNSVELVLRVLEAKIFTLDELVFCHKNFVISPLPDKSAKNQHPC
jgi:DNA-binding NarL/FixJ family response regulator